MAKIKDFYDKFTGIDDDDISSGKISYTDSAGRVYLNAAEQAAILKYAKALKLEDKVGNLEEGKKNMEPYLTNYSPMKGVFINGVLNDFEFEKLELTDKAIIAFITTSGKMNIKIDGME